ncbi:hypothetical protein BKA07_002339 [Brevibacterium marinum]|uniref:Uncharacterized protein n=1 Tax=Brevibacterium marinum TaxID=418643 RepID=A0A846RT91_9MICO|nr:hypothetical protein [Brevibacterium marinum]
MMMKLIATPYFQHRWAGNTTACLIGGQGLAG